MATETFKVSTKDLPTVEVSKELPDTLQDPRWADIVMNPDEDIHSLAIGALIVKCQAGARARLGNGEAAVQNYVDNYKFGARTGGYSAATISGEDAAAQGFTDEQLEFLRAAGVRTPVEAEEE